MIKWNYLVIMNSSYLIKGVNEWMSGWERNGWKNSKKQDVKNMDLWKNIQKVLPLFHDINFKWVKGHSNNTLNNECDEIAREMAEMAVKEKRDFMISNLPKNI